MAITERIIEILKAELNDWLDYFTDEKEKVGKDESTQKTPHRRTSDKSFHAKKLKKKSYKRKSGNYTEKNDNNETNNSSKKDFGGNFYHQHEPHPFSYSNNEPFLDSEKKYYDALEINTNASFEEIKIAYKKVMKKYNPNRFARDLEKQKVAIELCKIIEEAYNYFKEKFRR